MRKLPLAFFTAATVCVTVGMVWGAIMGSREDFALAPAHAHLNLVGWASLALMGTFYQLSGRNDRLGWANYAISTLAVVISIPALAMLLGGNAAAEKFAILGSVLAIVGVLTFLGSIAAHWRQARTA